MTSGWPGGYIAPRDIRPLVPPWPDRTTAWGGCLALIDTANGIAVREPPTAWMYPNVDLTLLHRRPEGRWTVPARACRQGVDDVQTNCGRPLPDWGSVPIGRTESPGR